MTIDLMPWIIAWAMVTTVVVILALWRLMEGLHDDGGLHFIEGTEKELAAKSQMSRRLEKMELAGKALTVVAAVMIVGIALAWAYNGILAGQ